MTVRNFLRRSLLFNAYPYLALAFGLPPIFILAAGTGVNILGKGMYAGLMACRDALGIARLYALDFTAPARSDSVYIASDGMGIKPRQVIAWREMRGRPGTLRCDAGSGEVILNVPGYLIKAASEWVNSQTVGEESVCQ